MITQVVPPVLAHLLAEREQAAAKEAAALAEARSQTMKEAQAKIEAAFGPLWPEVQPYLGQRTVNWNGCALSDFGVEVNTPILDFWIRAFGDGAEIRLAADRHGSMHPSDSPRLKRHDDPGVVAFLAERIARRQSDLQVEANHAAAVRQNRIKSLADGLTTTNYHYAHHPKTVEAAEAQRDELIQLDPANETEWHGRFLTWHENYQRCLQEQAEEEAQKRAEAEKKVLFRQAYITYLKERGAAVERNTARVADIQAQYDGTFYTWELGYGVVADGEDGRFADVRTVVVLADRPDESGYWPVVNWDGGVIQMKFSHVVSLTAAKQRNVSEGDYTQTIYVTQADNARILLSPFADAAAVLQEVAAVIEPLPARPDLVEWGLGDLPNAERRELTAVVGKADNDDEPPF